MPHGSCDDLSRALDNARRGISSRLAARTRSAVPDNFLGLFPKGLPPCGAAAPTGTVNAAGTARATTLLIMLFTIRAHLTAEWLGEPPRPPERTRLESDMT